MKLQCSCGAKYAFDATPEMLQNPVKFVCPACGLDASAFVNELIRQEFGGQYTPPPPPSPPPAAAPASRLKISHEAAPVVAAPEAPTTSKFCSKHHERATEQCAVCHKPICPKCLEMFGFFCSPLCKNKAVAENLDVPVYAGRKDLVESQLWRKTGLIMGGLAGLVVLFFVGWIWYAWFGSVPHPYFAVRFEDDNRGYYGHAELVGKDKNQLVFLHGGTLARYDLKTKKPVWTDELVTKQEVDASIKAAAELDARMNQGNGYKMHRNADDIERSARQELQAELKLRVSGQNIWVGSGEKLTHYDWDTGKALREITLPETEGELVDAGDELQIIGAESVTHISLASGDSHVEQFGPAGAKTVEVARDDAGGGLPGNGQGMGDKPLDPKKVEAQAQNLNIQGRIALPAVLSNARHEAQLEAALNDDPKHPGAKAKGPPADAVLFQLVPGKTGFVEFAYRMVEEHFVTRSAMKAPPKKSALDGDLNVTKTGEVANEILNEMQRNAGGSEVTEDQSRYKVTVHLPDGSAADWTGEVIGPPQLIVLKTVNVIAAGKSVTVLDKSNKKLWDATLTYAVSSEGSRGLFSHEESPYGEGPCVEHGDTLYVFDQAVLTSFDLNSGNARWRLPSVGVVGLFFDDKNNVYVNTTTGNPDDIKYSRQIDVDRSTQAVLEKIDPKAGKILWSIKPGGFVSYLSGKFIYVIDCYDPNRMDEDVLNDMTASMQKPAFLRITRIRPSDGKIMWDYYDRDRSPVNWNFSDNSIQLIFKREVQVLRYVTF